MMTETQLFKQRAALRSLKNEENEAVLATLHDILERCYRTSVFVPGEIAEEILCLFCEKVARVRKFGVAFTWHLGSSGTIMLAASANDVMSLPKGHYRGGNEISGK